MDPIDWSWNELHAQVACARAGLVRLAVGRGDRAAAYLPNMPHTIAAFLATASLGAIWTSCAPEFGVRAVLDRCTQVEPTVLIGVEGYRYAGRSISKVAELAAIRAGLPSLQATVVLPYPDAPITKGVIGWDQFTSDIAPLEFEQVPADHPLYVLYSSGTTGMPKAVIHGQGGMLLEHLKVLGLLSSISGGTDVCSAFVGGSPLSPVWAGEISCRYLGAAVAAFDDAHQLVVGEQGELVLTKPMPSMPVGFWGDDDGSRYSAAYVDGPPGVWRHGDWITITERGSCISGRSDATLNRGGVRVGTAEFCAACGVHRRRTQRAGSLALVRSTSRVGTSQSKEQSLRRDVAIGNGRSNSADAFVGQR